MEQLIGNNIFLSRLLVSRLRNIESVIPLSHDQIFKDPGPNGTACL